MYTKEPELCSGTEMLVVHQLMSECNSQEASSPAQQGSPLSVTQHANNSLDEPVSDSNVSTTNHGLAAVEADDWVDEGEEIEVQWMSKEYYYYYLLELRCTIEESVKTDCFDIFSALYNASYRFLYNILTSPSIMSEYFSLLLRKHIRETYDHKQTYQRFVIIHHTNTSTIQKDS